MKKIASSLINGVVLYYCVCPPICISQGALKIGERLPEITFANQYRQDKPAFSTTSLKGKVIIFDFWNIWCKACLEGMPKMEYLQHKFKERIQIVLVTANSREQVASLFSRIKIKLPDLPVLVSDTVLNKFFPHEGEPFHAWVDADGKVRHLTDGYYANENNISLILQKQNLDLPVRNSPSNIDFSNGLIQQTPSLNERISGYSIFFKGLHEITNINPVKIVKDSTSGKVKFVSVINSTKWQLLNIAFNERVYGFPISLFKFNNRFVIGDSLKRSMLFPTDSTKIQKWKDTNMVSYELSVADIESRDGMTVMQDDLNRYLDITAKIEKRKIRCLVLECIGPVIKIKSKNAGNGKVFKLNFETGVLISNGQLKSTLIYSLAVANMTLQTPIVDGTHFKEAIDIALNCDLRKIEAVKRELRKYNLDLIEKVVPVEMVVITPSKK